MTNHEVVANTYTRKTKTKPYGTLYKSYLLDRLKLFSTQDPGRICSFYKNTK